MFINLWTWVVPKVFRPSIYHCSTLANVKQCSSACLKFMLVETIPHKQFYVNGDAKLSINRVDQKLQRAYVYLLNLVTLSLNFFVFMKS